MRYTTTRPLSIWFAKIDVAEKYSLPCLLVAGSGDEPDYSKLELVAFADKNVWRAGVQELQAKAARLRVPYVPLDPDAPRLDSVPPAPVETNPVIQIDTGPLSTAAIDNDIGAL